MLAIGLEADGFLFHSSDISVEEATRDDASEMRCTIGPEKFNQDLGHGFLMFVAFFVIVEDVRVKPRYPTLMKFVLLQTSGIPNMPDMSCKHVHLCQWFGAGKDILSPLTD
jgi:hypothetical protein